MTRKITRKTAYQKAVAAAKKMSSSDLRAVVRDVRRQDWGSTKMLGLTRRQRKPAARELNTRYRKNKRPVSSFHASQYSVGELRAIAAGRCPESFSWSMQRTDVPLKCRDMALEELSRRQSRRY